MKAMLFVVAFLLAPFTPSLATPEVPAGNTELKIGDVNFPVSCNQQAQEQVQSRNRHPALVLV